MRVRDLLEKRPGELVRAAPDTPLRTAAALMADSNVSAVLVTPADGVLSGILTERDVSRYFGAGNTMADAVVSDVMTTDVITCSADHEAGEIAAIMSKSHIRHMPVMRDGALVDIVSMRDIVRFHLAAVESENRTLRDLVAALD